jgi:hypothetical protein
MLLLTALVELRRALGQRGRNEAIMRQAGARRPRGGNQVIDGPPCVFP